MSRLTRLTIAACAALFAGAAAAQQCPSDNDIRNMEVSASSITLKRDQRQQLQEQIRLARACRMGPDALRSERAQQDADRDRRQTIQDFSRCRVEIGGTIWCPPN